MPGEWKRVEKCLLRFSSQATSTTIKSWCFIGRGGGSDDAPQSRWQLMYSGWDYVLWHLDNLALEVIKLTGVLFVPPTGAHVTPDGFLEKNAVLRQVPAVGPVFFFSGAKAGRGSVTCVCVNEISRMWWKPAVPQRTMFDLCYVSEGRCVWLAAKWLCKVDCFTSQNIQWPVSAKHINKQTSHARCWLATVRVWEMAENWAWCLQEEMSLMKCHDAFISAYFWYDVIFDALFASLFTALLQSENAKAEKPHDGSRVIPTNKWLLTNNVNNLTEMVFTMLII